MDRAQLLAKCKELKKKGATTIDCRSSTIVLQAEIDRILGGSAKFRQKLLPPPVIPPEQAEIGGRTPDYIYYNVLIRLPITVLLRLRDGRMITDELFWRLRLELTLPRALIPSWVGTRVSQRHYALLKRDEIVGRIHVTGGSHGMDWGNEYNKEDLYTFAHLKMPIRLISESGPFCFVGLDGNLYQFGVNYNPRSNITIVVPLTMPKTKGTITKIVGLAKDMTRLILYADGELYSDGTFHELRGFNTLQKFYDEPVSDINISLSHCVAKTNVNYYVIGDNSKREMADGSKVNHLPFDRYGKLSIWEPLEVPVGTVKVIPGKYCTYALTMTGGLFVVGVRSSLLGVDLEGKNFIHTWRKIDLIPPTEEQPKPIQPIVIKLVTSYDHTLALTSEGEVYAWGRFTAKEFGWNKHTQELSPKLVFNQHPVIDIETSRWRTSILTIFGDLYIYGAYEGVSNLGNSVVLSKYDQPKVISGIKLCRNFSVGSIILI